jgi:hypothetical protein
VILFGVVQRSLGHVVQSLRERVIEPLSREGQVEVFFHSWDLVDLVNPRTGEDGTCVDPGEVARLLPEARGVFESQAEFDATVDWQPLFERNPMGHCAPDEDAARATLMNHFRALESLERAWRFFEEAKSGSYRRIVVARPDLRFLEDLVAEPSSFGEGALWIPEFHGWGGVNDRFAMGGEREMGIWCRRLAFAKECVLEGRNWNSETVLMKWLEKNRLPVRFMDFVFQRVRATGSVAEMDRDLAPGGGRMKRNAGVVNETRNMKVAGMGQEAVAPKERFLILAREAGSREENLRKVLEPLGKVEVVVDRPSPAINGGHIHLSDEEAEKFGGLMSTSGSFPWVTAWSRALCHLSRTLGDEEAVWFVEDDVAGDKASFAMLARGTAALAVDLVSIEVRTIEEDHHWPLWHYADGFFSSAVRSFQPMCRLSGRLIRAVLACREKHGRCTFHEVMFPSVAREHGMSWRSWCQEPGLRDLVASFRYRPEVRNVFHGVSHPVKDPEVHEAICCLPPAEFPRMRQASLEGWSINSEDYIFLVRHCRRLGIRRVAEFGPGDSTLAFLDAGCEVMSFEHDAGWLLKARDRFQREAGVSLWHCPEGSLPGPESATFEPEMVFVDGPPFRQGQEMSRLMPCEWALARCGYLILHDTKRSGEMATLAELERRGMIVTRIPTRKGLAIVADPARQQEKLAAMEHERAALYEGAGGWWENDLVAWRVFFGSGAAPVKALEIGAGTGASANLLLDRLFTHECSEVHCIDLYEGETGRAIRQVFEVNAGKRGHAGRLHLYEGMSREILAWMIVEEGYWQSFEFIHLAALGEAWEVLSDACQAWELLKIGGVMVFGPCPREGDSRSGIDAFLNGFGRRLERILEGERLVVQKIR